MTRSGLKEKQNPQLKQRVLSGGKIALYLEYYEGRSQEPRLDENGQPMFYPSGTKMAGKPMYIVHHERKQEELKLYLIAKPRTQEERNLNKETEAVAKRIRFEKEQERNNDIMGYRINIHKNDNIIAYFDTYLDQYTKKDKRNIALAINRFKTFLREYRPACATKKTAREIESIDKDWADNHKYINGKHAINENAYYRFSLKPGQLNREMVSKFVDYLKDNSQGEGAATVYERFKKIVKSAIEKGIIKVDPCKDIKCKREEGLKKEILSPEEIITLVQTHYPGENAEIRKAFILTLYTGIRFCDVKDLRFSNIDYSKALLTFNQAKTHGHSKNSKVEMPLRSDIIQMIGRPEDFGKTRDDRIVDLPSHTMCLKALRHWTARAGIDKHITWHCGRHSFATNILIGGADVVTTARLLGHTNLRTVEVYVHSLAEEKRKAVNSLPGINL